MALQSNGAISMDDIVNEFGGNASPKLSDYYRGGSFVPSEIGGVVNVREPAAGYTFSQGNTAWLAAVPGSGGPNYTEIKWGGTQVYGPGGSSSMTSRTVGAYTYYKGPTRKSSSRIPLNQHGFYFMYSFNLYRTSQQDTSQAVNTNVPTSGAISFSDLYGAKAS